MKCSRCPECRRRDPTTAVPDLATERALKAEKIRWCPNEGDAPALHDAASLGVPDSVRFALLAIAAHFPSHTAASSFLECLMCTTVLAVKHLEWRPHLECLVQSHVLEARNRHEQLPHMDDRKTLSASTQRTMAQRVLPTRSDTPICCGVLVVVNSCIIPASKQYCRNSSPVYSPPFALSSRQRTMRPPKEMTVEPTNN